MEERKGSQIAVLLVRPGPSAPEPVAGDLFAVDSGHVAVTEFSPDGRHLYFASRHDGGLGRPFRVPVDAVPALRARP